MLTEFLMTIPVIPSANIERDVAWYTVNTGFKLVYADNMYAVLFRKNLSLHLQWHADTVEDPLLGGSVVRIHVKNIAPIFNEFVERGTISKEALKMNTPWGTNEFGFYDLNKNALFVFEDV
jgi:hypothetical protein